MNVKYWVAFSSIEELDSTFVQRLYNYFGDIEAAYKSSKKDLEQIEGLNVRKAELFLSRREKIDLDKTWYEVEKRGISVITFDNSNYPYMLKQIHNPPMVLYYKGNLLSCNLERTVAFVGSRRASAAGKDAVQSVINDFRNTDICIVSGLAEGIDAISHRSAIENNLKTIGVIASGFDYSYPVSNRNLYEKLEHGFGAVVTEYYPKFEPIKFRFPQRNRIVTGLSYGTVVGEAAIKSGALISANLTLEQGRELMCIPGAINNKNTEGIYKLLKNGATMVTSGEDVLNTLGWEIKKQTNFSSDLFQQDSTKMLNPKNNNMQDLVLDLVSIEPKGFDELQAETGLKTDELLTQLTVMEIEGLIEQIDGDRYKRAASSKLQQ